MKPKSSLLPFITTAGIGILAALLLIVVIENQRHLASAREEQASLELRINEALKSDSATSVEAGLPAASRVTFTNQISAQDIETIKLRYAKMNSITPQEREELNAKINQLKERMQGFTVDDVGKYLESVVPRAELTKDMKSELMYLALRQIHVKHPKEACDYIVQHKAIFQRQDIDFIPMISGCLKELCTHDPDEALNWLFENRNEHNEVIPQESYREVIEAIAVKDRKLAFELAVKFDVSPLSNVTQGIVCAAKSDEEQLLALKELREFTATIADEGERRQTACYSLGALGRVKSMEGFEKALAWANKANLSSTEWLDYSGDLGSMVLDSDYSKWLNYMNDNIREKGARQSSVRGMVYAWLSKDQKACEQWLENVSDGYVKNHAIYCYAATIASLKPEKAIEWAKKATSSEIRTETLHKIYHEWPTDTPEGKAAAAAFEKEYEIVHDH